MKRSKPSLFKPQTWEPMTMKQQVLAVLLRHGPLTAKQIAVLLGLGGPKERSIVAVCGSLLRGRKIRQVLVGGTIPLYYLPEREPPASTHYFYVHRDVRRGP